MLQCFEVVVSEERKEESPPSSMLETHLYKEESSPCKRRRGWWKLCSLNRSPALLVMAEKTHQAHLSFSILLALQGNRNEP
jgi:hypothetical protein